MMPSWSLKFYILFSVLKHLLYVSNNFERVEPAQKITKLPNPNTSNKAIASPVDFRVRQEAIDFMLLHSIHIPSAARNNNWKIDAEWVTDGKDTSKIVYLLHGGAYILGSPQMERKMAYLIAKFGACKTFGISYRLAPQYEFPCAVIDSISGYMYLLELGHDPKNIIFSGASAGGGLAMSCLLAIRDMNLPLPGGAILMSPWVDLKHSFPSFHLNKDTDYLPTKSRFTFGDRRNPYAPDDVLHVPFVSPIWAPSLSGLDLPILIQVGAVERLFDEDVMLAKRLQNENPDFGSRLEIYKEQVHVFQIFPFLPCSKSAFQNVGTFIQSLGTKKFTSQVVEINPNGKMISNKAKL